RAAAIRALANRLRDQRALLRRGDAARLPLDARVPVPGVPAGPDARRAPVPPGADLLPLADGAHRSPGRPVADLPGRYPPDEPGCRRPDPAPRRRHLAAGTGLEDRPGHAPGSPRRARGAARGRSRGARLVRTAAAET